MTPSDESDPEDASKMQSDGNESAEIIEGDDSELQERLAAIRVPKGNALPDPPEIHFTRPTLGRSRSGNGALRNYSESGASSDSEGDNGKPSHLGASLVIGITFPTCVIVGASIGIWIDHRWNPSGTPWGTIIMSLAGIAAGFMNVFRVVTTMDRGKAKKK